MKNGWFKKLIIVALAAAAVCAFALVGCADDEIIITDSTNYCQCL